MQDITKEEEALLQKELLSDLKNRDLNCYSFFSSSGHKTKFYLKDGYIYFKVICLIESPEIKVKFNGSIENIKRELFDRIYSNLVGL